MSAFDPEARFDRAADRHPGPLDVSSVDEIRVGIDEGRWGCLALPGQLIQIETTRFSDADAERAIALAVDHIRTSRTGVTEDG
jgi:hypothetical protein